MLGVGLALLCDGVHEGLGGEAGCFGGGQALGHTVHVHILGKCLLQMQECIVMVMLGVMHATSETWQGLALLNV